MFKNQGNMKIQISKLLIVLSSFLFALNVGLSNEKELLLGNKYFNFKIRPSNYLVHLDYQREEAFSEWQHRKDSQELFEEMARLGNLPFLTEVKIGGYKRRLFIPAQGYFYTRSQRKEKDFVSYHMEYLAKGYVLLSFTIFKDQFNKNWYSSTWVPGDDIHKYDYFFEYYGIEKASSVTTKIVGDRP